MDSTTSVSKGCFVFKNGATRAEKTKKKSSKRSKHDTEATSSSMLAKDVTEQPFYKVYRETWQRLQMHIEELQQVSYARILESLVEYVTSERVTRSQYEAETYGMDEILPAAALLTGINQPDHLEQFETLALRIRAKISASVCVLQSRDCATLKAGIETMVYSFVEAPHEDDEDRDHKRLRRSQCTMKQLKRWYCNNYPRQYDGADNDEAIDDATSTSGVKEPRHALVVILPDFECFTASVLQDFILIMSSHCGELPFVLILGVATAVSAVHNSLPYHVTSKMKLRVFQTQPAPVGLNEILEQVILSPKYAFRLSGKAFKFLTHIFLYYDFSINGFIQGFKYCLIEHFFQGNAYALCTSYTASLTKLKAMTHADMEAIRRLLSFRPYVESINDCKRIIAVLTDDDYLKKKLPQLLRDCHLHFLLLRTFLELLATLVTDLPKAPLGRLRRELYAACLSKELSTQPEFKECWQMLSFTSKDELVAKVTKAIEATQTFVECELHGQLDLAADCEAVVRDKLDTVQQLLSKVIVAGMAGASEVSASVSSTPRDELRQLSSRHDLKERLLALAANRQDKSISEYGRAVQALLAYIRTEIVEQYLAPLQRAPPLHELFVFADIATVRRNIIGAPRAALHMALNNPFFYLQCKCCALEEHTQMLSTLPDLSVAYKLHLECGRMINLFDWLQAFRAVVDFNEEDQEQVDPQIQARFTRAVAELQFLGYIKMSKRKTDHATRLTW